MTDEIKGLEFEKPVTELEQRIDGLKKSMKDGGVDFSGEIEKLSEKCEKLKSDIYKSLKPWQRVQLARHPKRPYTLDYVSLIFKDFVELHGDRSFADDNSLVAGIAMFDSNPVVVIGQQKGRDLGENMKRNFAMVHPEGYRKALRLMKLAEKFNRPVITFIDTPGAYPGIDAEERGQSEAIARNLREMSDLKVPIISVVIGEGGSGGALGIGVPNRMLMLENAYYSVITPEGCAAILFRDASRAPEAAEALKITAGDLRNIGVVDEVIKEPLGGAHRDFKQTAKNVKDAISKHLSQLKKMSANQLMEDRFQKYRKLGVYLESGKGSISKNTPSKKAKSKKI